MLERKGYVRIQIDETNKKIHRLFLTEKSRTIADVLYKAQKECLAKILDGISEEELTGIYRFFEKCDANIQKELSRLKSKDNQ